VVLHICVESQSYSQGVLDLIKVGFKHHNHEQVRPYFRTLLGLLEIKDSFQEWRVAQVLTALVLIMKEHELYWKMFDMCTEHLIRFAKKVPLAAKWLTGQPEVLDSIAGWLKANPKPPAPIPNVKSDMKLEKDRGDGIAMYQEKYDCYVQTSKYYSYGLTNQEKQINIELLKNGRESELDRKDVVYDSDELLEDRHWDKDEKVDALDTDLNWLPSQIIDTHPGKGVLIKYEGWSDKWNEWMPVWSPRLAKLGKLSVHNPAKKKKNN